MLLLVCETCRLVFLSVPNAMRSGSTRDPGHHSRFVPFRLLLAAAARGIGVDGASCGKPIHRSEPLTQGSEGRFFGAVLQVSPQGAGRRTDRVARSGLTTGQGARHVGSSLAPATEKALSAGALRASSLQASLRSDDAVGAEVLPQLRGQDCSSNRIGWCRYDPLA